MRCSLASSEGRLYDVGQEEAFRTELLMSRPEDGMRRLPTQLSRSSLYAGEEPRASINDLREAMKSSTMDISSLQSRKAKVRDGSQGVCVSKVLRLNFWFNLNHKHDFRLIILKIKLFSYFQMLCKWNLFLFFYSIIN